MPLLNTPRIGLCGDFLFSSIFDRGKKVGRFLVCGTDATRAVGGKRYLKGGGEDTSPALSPIWYQITEVK
jgi:hypothetical protein